LKSANGVSEKHLSDNRVNRPSGSFLDENSVQPVSNGVRVYFSKSVPRERLLVAVPPELKGFIKYTAFVIVELQDPFTVREAKGVILVPKSKDPLPNVVVEFRDAGGKIKATKTGSRGQFKFRRK
jgi:hypothetical protein